jgi:DNA end-binding protein Ku
MDITEEFLAKYNHVEEFNKLPRNVQEFFESYGGQGGGGKKTKGCKSCLKSKTKAELLEMARELDVKGRSKMNKEQLLKALKGK